jgi:formylglycine-generating enzyme required for sulfatase activity
VPIQRQNFQEEIHLTFEGPPHVRIENTLAKPGEDQIKVLVHAGRFAQTGDAAIRIDATAGHYHAEARLPVHIAPPDPGSYKAVQGENPRLIENRGEYYGRLTLNLADGTSIPFVLVAGTRAGSLAPFYIMENKVSNSLFRRFASANPAQARDPHWRRGGRIAYAQANRSGELEVVEIDLGTPDGWPVLRCSAEDAAHFASWLGGSLPTDSQWDAAAGRGDRKLSGPFLGEAKELIPWLRILGPTSVPFVANLGITPAPQWDWPRQLPLVAVNRPLEGPMPAGTALLDVSPSGCRDMAGNGYEWTRKVFLEDVGKRSVPLKDPQADDAVILRGQGYAQSRPLLFTDLTNEESNYYLPRYQDREEYLRKAAQTSFRVVLEPEW